MEKREKRIGDQLMPLVFKMLGVVKQPASLHLVVWNELAWMGCCGWLAKGEVM